MITEDYCSFEISKLLKEKGFKEITQGYINADKEVYMLPFQQGVYELSKTQYPYPTLQMALKWLREVHHIHIRLINSTDETYTYELYYNHGDYKQFRMYYDTYEQAVEAALKYTLENLI